MRPVVSSEPRPERSRSGSLESRPWKSRGPLRLLSIFRFIPLSIVFWGAVVFWGLPGCGEAEAGQGAPLASDETSHEEPGEEASNFGSITLGPGFDPDPHLARGTSGGSVAASSLSNECRGYVSSQPDHILVTTGDFAELRILVNAVGGDTTLVIRRPDGSYLCDDDSEGINPVVAAPFPAGEYAVFVGSYTARVNARYNLGISQQATVTTGQLGQPSSGGEGEMASHYGTVSLAPGFMPDPHVVAGRSGGLMPAHSLQEGCEGWIDETPDHLLVASGSFDLLRLMVRASTDTTLVVRRPDGTFECADDEEGRNPVVSGRFSAGTYRVWVGSYQQHRDSEYQLGFSSLTSTRTSDLR